MENRTGLIEEMSGEIIIEGEVTEQFREILTPQALDFLCLLHENFNGRRKELLEFREQRQHDLDNGHLPDFLEETAAIRTADWKVAPIPEDLMDRRVEITGPVDRKMVINALNSGAKVFMADFEDSNTPDWHNNIQGQINLRDAINGSINLYDPNNGKLYQLNEETATLLVRPRGWHLEDKYISFNGERMSGSLVDFGLYFFHNASNLINKGSGPYFYLPKIESHLEARLWNDVFVFAQGELLIPQCTIKATVLIETILASFELNEILYELRDHSAGLNCGRWDYIFSYIKKLRNLEGYVLPDRSQVGIKTPFMAAYSQLVIKTCHKRGVHAIGGMAAQIPIKNDDEANENALEKVRADKLYEVANGHDGTWVAHPGLVTIAMDIFDQHMPSPNQIHVRRPAPEITATDLLAPSSGSITEAGLRLNINVGILYIESWLGGNGAVAIYNLMEDAATAEISRTQVWQWINNESQLDDGRAITYYLYRQLLASELEKIKEYVGEERYQNGQFNQAVELFDRLIREDDFVEFLTLPAYEII
ncbi:MAG: malate synthase A [Cytophagales bacterium]|nr:malate synthase A [Cytophagales bacterium]